MARVVWTLPARRDLRRIREHIEQDSRRAGRLFADRILDATRQLEQFPRVGRLIPDDERGEVRQIFVRGYRIVYLVRPERVDILTVVHGARLFAD